ncbi:protein of unknown function [Pilibacter termitis]|uniref:Transcobalamin-like C-terminal domain-containing protein n=1 Tax=Pilibacter termitis TaxID=263852 RepID=A0A1T4K5I9_9ENTE|nr:DUF4430 domain-containing protein [Pilibacter termitis]SJZ37672.1 protein of unknown function [Pilibacter termitis]
MKTKTGKILLGVLYLLIIVFGCVFFNQASKSDQASNATSNSSTVVKESQTSKATGKTTSSSEKKSSSSTQASKKATSQSTAGKTEEVVQFSENVVNHGANDEQGSQVQSQGGSKTASTPNNSTPTSSSNTKPKPVNPEDVEVDTKETYRATVSIRVDTILKNMDKLDPEKKSIIPNNGVILPKMEVEFSKNESAFEVLQRVTKEKGIHLEATFTPGYNSAYIEGIANIYEFDCGPLSGWLYKVNNWFPNYGSSRYVLQNGDVVEWLYTCDLGKDVGSPQ